MRTATCSVASCRGRLVWSGGRWYHDEGEIVSWCDVPGHPPNHAHKHTADLDHEPVAEA